MGVSFVEVYTRAISKLDSPDLTYAYNNSPILFYKIMYNYMMSGITLFNNPIEEIDRLKDYTDSEGEEETFEAGQNELEYQLSSTPLDGCDFYVTVDGNSVPFSYNQDNNSVILDVAPPSGSTVSIEWYLPGSFNQDLQSEELNIIASLLVLTWAEQERNFQLDIRTILGDKTYSIVSSAKNSIGNKVSWFDNLREQVNKDMNNFAWTMELIRRKKGYNYLGK